MTITVDLVFAMEDVKVDFEADVYRLSKEFFDSYSEESYPELMKKPTRPYNCLLIDTNLDYYICIPFRSNITRNNAFFFKGTKRSKKSRSGLDYEKMVLISDDRFLSDQKAVVDQDEYNIARKNLAKIAKDAVDYVNTYIAHVTGDKVLHERAYSRKYQFSTLPYFHDIMGID